MCACVRARARARIEINWTFKLQNLRPVSASLHLTPLIIAAREKRYNFPPRHYTLASDRIPRFFSRFRSDSPFNSRSSFLQLADRFPATDVYFASNWLESTTSNPRNSYPDKWKIPKERANRREDIAREKSISLHFSIEPALVLRPGSRLARRTRADVASVSRCV